MKPRLLLLVLSFALPCPSLSQAAATSSAQAAHVLNRLAYGPRPGDVARVEAVGIDRYIEAQLDPDAIALPETLSRKLDAIETDRQSAGRTLAAFQAARQAGRQGDQEARKATIARIAEQTARARLLRAVESPRQLQEVMVDFWFNHFNVFAGKGIDRALINAYERDAIRPNALGRFRTLLGATARDPAMLFYLDNWLSSADTRNAAAPGGPGAPAGQMRKAAGLNENYARELMELHTLGVDAGYTQADVTTLARMLTGWRFTPRALAQDDLGFRFEPARHDAGAKTWLGRPVTAQGQDEGEYALDVLAMHPATAHRLSYLLARYFIEDAPPAALVAQMTQRYLETGGDIRSVLHTLFFSREFRDPASAGKKFKTPYRYVISAVRAIGAPLVNVRPLVNALNQLGMPLYGCQTPDGYKNTEAAWLNPDALTRRLGFATALASGRLPLAQASADFAPAAAAASPPMLPMTVNAQATPPAQDDMAGMAQLDAPGVRSAATTAAPSRADDAALVRTLGPLLSAQTVAQAGRSPVALRAALLLGSPDFMQH